MSEFKSCPVCQENSDQCLSCASYVVDGERIYYEKLKDFGATKDHEIRFINRIQKQRVTAFFHNGKLYIPSRQGRSVPLAIGLQWDAWQEQQAIIDDLKAQLDNMEQCYIGVKKELDELEAAKRDYVCDCGYLDSPDYEECDCRKHSEDLANEVIAEIVKKANFAGLEELLDELKCRAIKHGVLLNKKALRGTND